MLPRAPYQPDTAEEGRFPFKADRDAVHAFMHASPIPVEGGTVMSIVLATTDQHALTIALEPPDDKGRQDMVAVARYDSDGAIELVFPHNPLVQAYARTVWNLILEWLDEPNDRRVTQVWEEGTKTKTGKATWPISHWLLDNRKLTPGDKHVLCGRLTLAAWRAANP